MWGAEYFRNYVLGRKFIIVTDHKALVSMLNGNNKKNKTMFSRLSRWLDRLIPFDFQVEHKPGAKLDSPITYRGNPAWMLNRSTPMIVCLQWRKLVELDPPSDLKRKLSPEIDSSLHRLLIINAFLLYRIENNR